MSAISLWFEPWWVGGECPKGRADHAPSGDNTALKLWYDEEGVRCRPRRGRSNMLH